VLNYHGEDVRGSANCPVPRSTIANVSSGWAADLLPHLAYRMATATVYEALAGRAG
jgi:hypothetical protein